MLLLLLLLPILLIPILRTSSPRHIWPAGRFPLHQSRHSNRRKRHTCSSAKFQRFARGGADTFGIGFGIEQRSTVPFSTPILNGASGNTKSARNGPAPAPRAAADPVPDDFWLDNLPDYGDPPWGVVHTRGFETSWLLAPKVNINRLADFNMFFLLILEGRTGDGLTDDTAVRTFFATF
jgi:hypothetical protein